MDTWPGLTDRGAGCVVLGMKNDRSWWYNRMCDINKRISLMKQDGLDAGHEMLVRFIEDLKGVIGAPAGCDPTIVIESRVGLSHTHNFRDARFTKTGDGFSHECGLRATFPHGSTVVLALDMRKEESGLWTVLVNGEPLSPELDASDYGVPEHTIDDAIGRIVKALHEAAWRT